MENKNCSRRKFINTVGLSAFAAGTLALPTWSYAHEAMPEERNINYIGPMKGYTPQIGTLISMLEWISDTVIRSTSKLSVEELDYLHDKNSNSIGALMMHVAATEVIYQDLTFNNLADFSAENKAKWGIAMDLGPEAQTVLKGNPAKYYIDAMNEARSASLAAFKKRDDEWLLSGAKSERGMNNYCKWFHVTEHFANHRGQITWYKKRLPGKEKE